MKIISWNCNGALRKKFEHLLSYNADIFIIQECENPLEIIDSNYKSWASNYLWIGDNKNKGVGIFAKEGIKLEKLNWSNQYQDHSVKYFLPCRVNNRFNLLAVWAHKNNSPNFGYIGQFWKYFQVNHQNFKEIIIAGDFNSNKIWDQWDRWWNHTDVVESLKKIDVKSLYHSHKNETQGEESIPTLYLQRKREKPYHIDYIFSSEKFLKELSHFEIGKPDVWLSVSDHMPIICEIKSI